MAEDGLPTIVDVGVTHSLADTYFSQNTSVGVRGYAADRYAKSKDTAMELEEPLTDAAAAYQRQKEADAAQHGEMAEVFAALRAALCVTRLGMMCAVKGELVQFALALLGSSASSEILFCCVNIPCL